MILLLISSCKQSTMQYPETRKENAQDVYFGTTVHDPYRWLEDDNAEETEKWVKRQNEFTNQWFKQINYRDKIKNRLSELLNYKRETIVKIYKQGLIISKNSGLQAQDELWFRDFGTNQEKLLLNPNTLSEDGTTSVRAYALSSNARYFAYALSRAGSDWQEISVLDIEKGQKLAETIKWVKFSTISWHNDGFYYSAYDSVSQSDMYKGTNQYQKIFYHKVGTTQKNDKLVYYNNTRPDLMYYAEVTEDEKYLIVYERKWDSDGYSLYLKNLENQKDWVRLTKDYEYEYFVVGNTENYLYVLTNLNAPNYKLSRINLNSLEIGNWDEILPQKKEILENIYICGYKVVAKYLKDANNTLEVYQLDGTLENIVQLPGQGTVANFNGLGENKEAYFTFSNYVTPASQFKFNVDSASIAQMFEPKLKFSFDDYIQEQFFYQSKDGTKVPITIVRSANMEKNSQSPCMLYGYGGFNISITPEFDPELLVWLENGGIYAHANIRGGGEYGKNWHEDGTLLKNKMYLNDFIAAAEYLIAEKYTSSKKLAIMGASNGGLLIGAVVNQRPELFQWHCPKWGSWICCAFINSP
ncbi:MAG: S9 family peptidase [Bacteroidales bacterium]|nr:S9 family peptidase [Bacteroidales bacterium]